jgi:hypothetical protein
VPGRKLHGDLQRRQLRRTLPQLQRQQPVEEIRSSLFRYGEHKVIVFDAWHQRFTG